MNFLSLIAGRTVKLKQGEINGATIRFEFALPRNDGRIRPLLFVGTVNGDAIRGEIQLPDGEAVGNWNAARAAPRVPSPPPAGKRASAVAF